MGIVYKARDPQIDRLVALKTVSLWGQEPEEEKEFRMRFMNEAQAAGRLHHAGIVQVFDVGESPENRDPYIVLEYVAGESLNKVLAREKKFAPVKALKLAEEIADALDYAHAQGVIHRDIKPANILITSDGHAKIADFGIAKLNLAHFTLPGKVLGTPAYMAPEQLSGEGVDGRSDLFSLGVILYALVTGHSPFQGDSATTVCFKVANREPIAASALDMTLPPQLDAVISRAMAKDPRERYQRGADFAEDLQILRQAYKPGTTSTSRKVITATGTGVGRTRTTAALLPVTGLAAVAASGRNFLAKARVRDLLLAVATVVMLGILAVQMKLFSDASRNDVRTSPVAATARASANFDAAVPGQPVQESAKPAVASASPTKKSTPKTSRSPARQIVVPFATLDLAIQHQFKDGTLYVWVDDKPALTLPLHGAAQKKLVVFNGVKGALSETMKIPAGKRLLRFRALSSDKTVDLSKTLSADFVGGDTKSLQVSFDKHNEAIRLTWQ